MVYDQITFLIKIDFVQKNIWIENRLIEKSISLFKKKRKTGKKQRTIAKLGSADGAKPLVLIGYRANGRYIANLV